MPVQLRHEALTEPHHFGIRLAPRVKVGTTLAAAHRQAGQGVLEGLLETQKFDDAQVDRRVEPQPAFIGPDGAVELDPETTVHPDFSRIIHPRHPENDLPLRLDQPFNDSQFDILRMLFQHPHQRIEDFLDRLVEFRLVRVSLDNPLIQFLTVLLCIGRHVAIPLHIFPLE